MTSPTRSQIDGANWDPLRISASAWLNIAHIWEAAFTEIRDAAVRPGGAHWTGAGAAAFQHRTAVDVVTIRNPVDMLVNAAGIATRGADSQDGNKQSVINAVNRAERQDFRVGEDLSVTDTYTYYTSAAEQEQRLSEAQQHESFIKSRVTTLVNNEHAIAQQLAAATAGLHEFGFVEDGADGGAGGQPHATLVDDVNAAHGPGSLPYMLDHVTPHLPAPNDRLSAGEEFIYDEMMKNVNSDRVKGIKHLLETPKWYEIGRNPPSDHMSALAGWTALVGPGQPWDHKPILERKFGLRETDDFFFPQPGTNRKVFYDVFSNVHYGFVGSAAGIDQDSLIKGASIADPILVGHDDYGDQLSMRAGIDLFNKYGPSMTAQQFHAGLMDLINQMDAAQRAGMDVPQIRHLPG